MCTDCGCADGGQVSIHSHPLKFNLPHTQSEGSSHPPDHSHSHSQAQTLLIKESVLSKNDQQAQRNREFFAAKGLVVLNVLSSPGAGKTTLIERTLGEWDHPHTAAVIVGDLATDNDAQRLRRSGAQVVQVTTGTVCHLDADMVYQSLSQLRWEGIKLLIIENVGNLVCPAAYDLGETWRVVLFSVTEGEDKPLKYPTTFKSAHWVMVSKCDLATAVDFDRESALNNIRQIAPQARILEVSARTGKGMDQWYQILTAGVTTHVS